MYLKVTLWTKGGHKITGNMIGAEAYDFDQRMQRVYGNDAGPQDLIYLHDTPDGPPLVIRSERIEAWQVLRVMEEEVVDEDVSAEDDEDVSDSANT